MDFDQPDSADVLQLDTPVIPATPVVVEGLVRVDEMPTINSYGRMILPIASPPVLLFPEDPRRKRILLTVNIVTGSHFVCIANNKSQAAAFAGMLLFSPSAFSFTAYEFHDRKALYVAPGLQVATANRVTLVAATTEMIVTWTVEQWAH